MAKAEDGEIILRYALVHLGIDHIDMPYTAPKLWAAMRNAKGH